MIPFHQIKDSYVLSRLAILLNQKGRPTTMLDPPLVFIVVRPIEASEDRDIQLVEIPVRHIDYPSILLPPLNTFAYPEEMRHLKPEYIYAIFPTRRILRSKKYSRMVLSMEHWCAHIEMIKKKTDMRGQKNMLERFKKVFIPLQREDFLLNVWKLEEILSQHHIKYKLL